MTRPSPSAIPLALVVLVAFAAAGCNRNASSSNGTNAKDAAKPAPALASLQPTPAPPPAQAAPPPAAPPPPPLPPPSPRMSNAQEAEFDSWIVRTYLGCWKSATQPSDSDLYVARVRVAFKPDGSLAKAPKLVNPPSDPALKPQAKSVMQAVQACNPLPVPAQYRPFYEQWRTKTIHFSPQVAAR